jgi:hypothetical protein
MEMKFSLRGHDKAKSGPGPVRLGGFHRKKAFQASLRDFCVM